MEKVMNLAGRLLLAQIFLLAGINKITGYAGTQGYMEAMGVPGGLLPLVIVHSPTPNSWQFYLSSQSGRGFIPPITLLFFSQMKLYNRVSDCFNMEGLCL